LAQVQRSILAGATLNEEIDSAKIETGRVNQDRKKTYNGKMSVRISVQAKNKMVMEISPLLMICSVVPVKKFFKKLFRGV
jgi:hypothetical protein